MKDSLGQEYVEIPEYPDDPYWQVGTLHVVQNILSARGDLVYRSGSVGEVVRHGRRPAEHSAFAELVMLSELTGIPLQESDYEILICAEGPVLRFPDNGEVWYCGQAAGMLTAITGHDPNTLYRLNHPEENHD